jgi:predicted molibdopterin-dependent oxidoreductase YjgC
MNKQVQEQKQMERKISCVRGSFYWGFIKNSHK